MNGRGGSRGKGRGVDNDPAVADALHTAIVHAISDAVFLTDDAGRLTYVCPNVDTTFGWNADEILEMETIGAMIPELPDRIAELDLESGIDNLELSVADRDGRQHELLVSARSVAIGDSTRMYVCRDISERNRLERELRYSESLFRHVFDLLPVGLWIADRDGTLLRGNPAGIRIWGAEPQVPMEEYGVFKARRLPSGEEIAADDWALAHTIRDGVTVSDELIEIDAFDGVTRVVLNSTAPVLDDDGSMLGAIVVNHDITAQHATEQSLRDSKDRFQALFESSPDLVSLVDLDGTFIDINRVGPGYVKDEVVGTNITDYLTDEQTEEYWAAVRHVLDTGEAASYSPVIRHPNGDEVHWHNRISPLTSGNEVTAFVVNFTDLTELRSAERSLRESEERFRTIFEESPDGALIVDLENDEVLAFNRRAHEYLGYTRDEFAELSIFDIEAAESTRETAEHIRRIIERGGDSFETRHRKKTGEIRVVDVTLTPMNWRGRRVFHTVNRDITEARAAEDEKARLEEQLRQSQKMEAIGRLAGGIAHDFNNLLTVINNYGDLVAMAFSDGDPLRSDIDEIRYAATRATELTSQLLAFSRKQIIQPKVIDVNTSIARAKSMLLRLIGEHIELVFEPQRDLDPILFDPGQLDQVLVNVAVNARDAMPAGGRLTITTANVEPARPDDETVPDGATGRHVSIEITDTGTGMDEETTRRVFEPFFTTKEVGEGSGLGMSTVFGIVTHHGGRVEIDSTPGRGTTVRVLVPATDERPDTTTAASSRGFPGGDETILLVEDEPAVRRIAERLLVSLGYRVISAENAGSAIVKVEKADETIDLVLTDVVMPDMSGVECVERLTAIRPDLRALFMSGYTDSAISHHGILDEQTNFIQKPFSVAALAAKVREVLDG